MRQTERRWGPAMGGGLRIRVPEPDGDDGVPSPGTPDTPSPASVNGNSPPGTPSPSPDKAAFPPGAGDPPPATSSGGLPPPPPASTTDQALAPAASSDVTTSEFTTSSLAPAATSSASSSITGNPASTAPTSTTLQPTTTQASTTPFTTPQPATLPSSTLLPVPVITSQPADNAPIANPSSTAAESNTASTNAGIDSSSDRPAMGTQVGIAMGTIAGLAFLVSILFCAYKWRKRRNNANGDYAEDPPRQLPRPWTMVTGLSWPGRRKQTDSKIMDEMMRAAYDAESGTQNYPPGVLNENGYIDEKNNAAFNSYYGRRSNNPGIPELATYDLRTPDPTHQPPAAAQQPRYSFLDRPPSEYWRSRQSRTSAYNQQDQDAGTGAADAVSPETPRSSTGPVGWFRREQRRVENVGAAHSRLVGQFEPHGLDLTLHSGGSGEREAQEEAERRARMVSMAPTEMTASTETTWKTWAVDKREPPKEKGWLERYLEKGGMK